MKEKNNKLIDPYVVKDIAENYDKIILNIKQALIELGVEPLKFWLWQGRARGEKENGDDIDIYVQVDNKYLPLVADLDYLNRKLRTMCPNINNRQDYHWICGDLLMDTRIGIGLPPKIEGPYVDLSLVKNAYNNDVYLPQWQNLDDSNKSIFDIYIRHHSQDYQDGHIRSFMISCPNENMQTGYQHIFYRTRRTEPGEINYNPRCEILFGTSRKNDGGIEPHDISQETIGTQPFGSYLRGHINMIFGVNVNGEWIAPDIDQFKPFITVQQYYKSDIIPEVDFLPQQVEITTYGIRKLLDKDLIDKRTRINLEDHSHPWDKYICHPLLLIEAGKIIDMYDKLPKDEVINRWRIFYEHGKKYTDKERALKCFEL